MLTKTFEYRQDREYGEMGWVAVDAPQGFNTGDGRLVAHDMLEHIPNPKPYITGTKAVTLMRENGGCWG